MHTTSRGPSAAIAAIPLLRPDQRHQSFTAVAARLRQLGYATAPSTGGRVDPAASEALSRYQSHHGLEVTGAFDASTRAHLSMPRCGMPDLRRGAAFTTTCAWAHPCVTFAFDVGTDDVPGTGDFAAVRRAVATWAAATPLTFTEVRPDQRPDVLIGWRSIADPDFDLSNDIAHADFPPGCGVIDLHALPRPVHFRDTGINWTDADPIFEFDIESAALHELGHIIGLGHSTREDTVMFPIQRFGRTKRALHPSDLVGVRRLYTAGIPRAGVVTIRQARARRFLDAHEIAGRDFRVVTRDAQSDNTQQWILTPVGSVAVIRQVSSGGFLDTTTSGDAAFQAVVRNRADNDSERWLVLPDSRGSVTIRQLATGRFLDAHETAAENFHVVTRPAQSNDTQRWILDAAGPSTFRIRQRSSGRFLETRVVPLPERAAGRDANWSARRQPAMDRRSGRHRLHDPTAQQRAVPRRPRDRGPRLLSSHPASTTRRHPAVGDPPRDRRQLHHPPTQLGSPPRGPRRPRPGLRRAHPAPPTGLAATMAHPACSAATWIGGSWLQPPRLTARPTPSASVIARRRASGSTGVTHQPSLREDWGRRR